MGADYVIAYECEVKRSLGRGDAAEGTVQLVRLLKLRATLDVVQSQGGTSVTRMVMRSGGPEVEEQSLGGLRAAVRPLEALAGRCDGCPAACGKVAFGCAGYLNYPVPAETERWIAARFRPRDTVPGFFMRQAIQDFRYTGAPMQAWRARRLFELRAPVKHEGVDTNQFFQALFAVGPALQPHHCVLVVLWLGMLRLDKERIETPDAVRRVMQLSRAQRAKAVAVSLGKAEHPGEEAAQRLIRALFRCWLLEVPLLVDA